MLLKDCVKKGELVEISREDNSVRSYMAYQKGDCLYLLSPSGGEVERIFSHA